ncbi:MAG: PKD domain-containing protein [Bdellovibrionales bacterium]
MAKPSLKFYRSALFFLLTLTAAMAHAAEPVFGPNLYSGQPKVQIHTAQVNLSAAGSYRIEIQNGKAYVPLSCFGGWLSRLLCELKNAALLVEAVASRIAYGKILFNNQLVLGPGDLNLLKDKISKVVALPQSNSIRLELRGLKGSRLTLAIYGQQAVNQAPVARVSASPTSGFAPLTVSLNGGASSDDSGIVSYDWVFGDGDTAQGALVQHVYQSAGARVATLTVTDNMGLSDSASVTIGVQANTAPTASFSLTPSSGTAPLMVLLDGGESNDAEGAIASYVWDFGDGQSGVGVQTTHVFQNAGNFTVRLTVADSQGLSGTTTKSLAVTAVGLPPDPATVAPMLSPTVATSYADANRFLFTGANPIQTGVVSGSLEDRRMAVLRGRVLRGSGQPLAGVQVRVKSHPEWGQTLSRADGAYDLAVNGGGPLSLNFSLDGYFALDRSVQPDYQNYSSLPDVVLLQPSQQSALIQVNSASAQVMVGEESVDAFGARQPRMYFAPNTTADAVLPGGTRIPLAQMTVRATEFTVGDGGSSRMPAPLPTTTAYTYAVELSVDEAMALGAKTVEFSAPVSFYLDNFLNFPIGVAIPVGTYDSDVGQWLPEANGQVIQILSENNSQAVLDLNGSGQPATATELDALGITTAELIQLANLYQAPKAIWRMRNARFSPKDLNCAASSLPGEPPARGPLNFSERNKAPNYQCGGSRIDRDSLILSESLPVVGAPFDLVYNSDRSPGWRNRHAIDVNLGINLNTTGMREIVLKSEVAGRVFTQSFAPQSTLNARFEWDGLDAYGRAVLNPVQARFTIDYLFDANYLLALPSNDPLFGSLAGFNPSSVPAREAGRISRSYLQVLGNSSAYLNQGVAGWNLSIHHSYDPVSKNLYAGDGGHRLFSELGLVVKSLNRSRANGSTGDGGPVREATFMRPTYLTVGPDGAVYVSDINAGRIRKIDNQGIVTTVVQNIGQPGKPSVGPDGSLYFADTANHVIHRLSPLGVLSTIAGTGAAGFGGDRGPAAAALLNFPRGVFMTTEGRLLIADSGNHRIRQIDVNGIMTTIAGTGVAGNGGNGGPALNAQLSAPYAVAMLPGTDIFISDAGGHSIKRLDSGGVLTRAVGTGVAGALRENGSAATTLLDTPTGLSFGPDGNMVIADRGNRRIRLVTSEGLIRTISGNGQFNLDGYALQLSMGETSDVAYAPDGAIYVADGQSRVVYRISPMAALEEANRIYLASEDGQELYEFDQNGRHLNTLFARTGAVKHGFEYDVGGFLIQVRDAFGAATVITRDSLGRPSRITAPDGQETNLGVNGNGQLTALTSPQNQRYEMQYHASGLLAEFKKPKGNASRFYYNAKGELTRDENDFGGFFEYLKTFDTINLLSTVQETTAEGRVFASNVTEPLVGSGQQLISRVHPDGFIEEHTIGSDGTRIASVGSGLRTTSVPTEDPRFGLSAAFNQNQSLQIQTGFVRFSTQTRQVTYPQPLSLFNYVQADSLTLESQVSNVPRTYHQTYDSSVRTETLQTPLNRVLSVVYSPQQQPVQIQFGGLTPVSMDYDPRGRLINQQQGARFSSFTYNAQGFLRSITNSLNQVTSFNYDLSGRVVEQILDDGRVIGFNYDNNGNLTGVTPPGRPVHGFNYNVADEPSEYLPPLLGGGITVSTVYNYNLDRQVTRAIRPDGKVLDYAYAQGALLTGVLASTGESLSFSYNQKRIETANASADNVNLFVSLNPYAIPWGYTWSGDVVGNIRIDFNRELHHGRYTLNNDDNHAMDLGYSLDEELIRVDQLNLTRNTANGLITGSALGSVSDTYGHNSFGEIISYSAPSLNITYTRDNLGRLSRKVESFMGGASNTFDYTYDRTGRLTQVMRNGAVVGSYAYDANSNRTSINGMAATYDSQDRIVSFGAITYGFNTNGEQQSKVNTLTGQVTSNSFDAFGNLKSVTLPSGTVILYKYDGLNRRVARVVNGVMERSWLYIDQLRPLAELDGSGNIISMFGYASKGNAPDMMIRSGIRYRIITDHLGSPRLVINATTGAIAQAMDYDEWGNVTMDTSPGFQPFGFAGGLYDPGTKLLRLGARDYDPEIGRWISKDPILFGGGDTNLYGYVLNDPINFIDPTGLFLTGDQIAGIVGGAIGGGAYGAYYGTYINPGFGTGAGAIAGVLIGGTIGGVLGPHVGGFIPPAYGSEPPLSRPQSLPPYFQSPRIEQPPMCR